MKLSPATMAKYNKHPVYEGVMRKFPRALVAIAQCSKCGAAKHSTTVGSLVYKEVPGGVDTYYNALARHLLSIAAGDEVNEEDGGVLHATQVAWNALAALEIKLTNQKELEQCESH